MMESIARQLPRKAHIETKGPLAGQRESGHAAVLGKTSGFANHRTLGGKALWLAMRVTHVPRRQWSQTSDPNFLLPHPHPQEANRLACRDAARNLVY